MQNYKEVDRIYNNLVKDIGDVVNYKHQRRVMLKMAHDLIMDVLDEVRDLDSEGTAERLLQDTVQGITKQFFRQRVKYRKGNWKGKSIGL